MDFIMAKLGDIPLDWFREAGRAIANAPLEEMVPPQYRAAWRFNQRVAECGVTLLPFKGGFRQNDISFDGLTKQLELLFYPFSMRVSTGGGKTGGSGRGNTVDAQIADLVNKGKLPENGELARYTQKTLTQLFNDNLKPFAAQVCVGWTAACVATSLDMVCIDMNTPDGSRIVNVQLKTGFDRNYERSNDGAKMVCPYYPCPKIHDMVDSIANRHKLQLIMEHIITQRATHNALSHSQIIVISEKTHTIIPLEKDEDVWYAMAQNMLLRLGKSELSLQIKAIRRKHAHHQILKQTKIRRRSVSIDLKK